MINLKKNNFISVKCTQLIDTAKLLFFKHGIKRVSVEEICEKAKVSKVTFYKYFENKENLISHIRSELLSQGFSKFDEINELELSFPEKVELITKWRIEFFSNMNSEFIEDILSIKDTEEEIKKRYLKNIVNAQKKNEVRKDLDPEFIWLVTEKLNEIAKEGSWKRVFNEFGEYQKQLRKMYFYGILENIESK